VPQRYQISEPAILEALAIREAIALAVDLSYNNVVIASDCKEVIDDINNGIGGQYASMVREILVSAKEFTTVSSSMRVDDEG
jgi:hypothetical protein